MLDCVLSLLRQWVLPPHIGREPASALRSPMGERLPSFESLDPFQPSTSAIIQGALLSLILFYMTVFAVPYSWSHVLNPRFPKIAGDPTQTLSWDSRKSSERLQVDVVPTDSGDFHRSANLDRKAIASSAPVAPVQPHGAVIWLNPYVGTYISNSPPMKISIQIEGDSPKGNHLSLSLAAAGHSSLTLSPVSSAKFIIVGAENSYVDFTTDALGRICCLSLVANGNVITAQRQ